MWSTSRDPLLHFETQRISLERVKLGALPRDFKFGVRIGRQACKPKKCKSRSKGAWPRSRDLLL